MSQTHQLSACPGCEEPLETGDSFCEVCGYDLTAVPQPPQDRPTVAVGTHAPGRGPDPRPAEAPPAQAPPAQAPGQAATAPGQPAPAQAARTPGQPAPAQAAQTPGQQSEHPARPAGSPARPGNGHAGAGDEQAAPVSAAHPPTADFSAPDFPAPDSSAAPDSSVPDSSVPGLDEGDSGEDTADLPVVERPTVEDYPLAAPAAPDEGPAKVCVACRAGRIDDDGYCENCGHAQPRERDHQERELASVAAVSDRGLRHHRNEDAFAISEAALPDGSTATIAVVCDGVSSATRPDEASAAAATAANTLLLESLPRGTHPQQALHEAILAAAEAVNVLAAQQARPMEHDPHRHQNAPACTLVSSIIAGGLLVVGWIGDSRVYWVPDDRSAPPARLTEDDSWAAQMVAAGLMGEAEAYADDRAHAITGWLGADAYEIDPHTASFKPDRPGVVVVCTDGLWNYAEAAQEMAHVIPADAARRPLHSAQVLVGHALDGGGHDNVTVAVLPFPMLPLGAGSGYGAR
ncbi:protein phosphatase 2C domain-containing protein [Streptomyces sp. NPDC091272]|uniref:protein phosphatase 2C domain-containing protein n=1 Tax=Streptomyces sp. NPDC091272 TaxID=3365981 RepID=UPI0037F10CC3